MHAERPPSLIDHTSRASSPRTRQASHRLHAAHGLDVAVRAHEGDGVVEREAPLAALIELAIEVHEEEVDCTREFRLWHVVQLVTRPHHHTEHCSIPEGSWRAW